MAKPRKKKRVKSASAPRVAASRDIKAPKSLVIRIGASEVGPSVSQLVKDVRAMMEPGTASRLKERRSNRLKDYTSMAGPLGVTHLLLFSRSTAGNTNMRLAVHPRGPTMHFQVERYSLCKDVQGAQRHPRGAGTEYKTPPLLVMNNFQTPDADANSAVPKHLEQLAVTVFQSLFPAISPHNTPLSSVRRVMLLNRETPTPSKDGSNPEAVDEGSFVVNLRHYAITTKRTGLSRGVRKINAAERLVGAVNGATTVATKKRGAMPNLGKLQDVSDYLLDPEAASTGFTSGSDSEVDTDAEVEVLDARACKVLSQRKLEAMRRRKADGDEIMNEAAEGASIKRTRAGTVEKRAVKLVELGPRMRLRLTKVEDGLCEGRTMWHEFFHKTEAEEKELEERWNERNKLREERKKKQRENVERKRMERGEKVEKKGENGDAEDDEDEMEVDEWDSEDDEAYYANPSGKRQEAEAQGEEEDDKDDEE